MAVVSIPMGTWCLVSISGPTSSPMRRARREKGAEPDLKIWLNQTCKPLDRRLFFFFGCFARKLWFGGEGWGGWGGWGHLGERAGGLRGVLRGGFGWRLRGEGC